MRRIIVTLTIVLCAAFADAAPDPGSCDRTGDARVTVRDALAALQDAVDTCRRTYECDSNGDYAETASDALALLRYAVGIPQVLQCSCIAFDECFSDADCLGRDPYLVCSYFLCAECEIDDDCDEVESCDFCTRSCQPTD